MMSHRGLSHLLLLALFLQKQRPAAFLQYKQPEKAVLSQLYTLKPKIIAYRSAVQTVALYRFQHVIVSV